MFSNFYPANSCGHRLFEAHCPILNFTRVFFCVGVSLDFNTTPHFRAIFRPRVLIEDEHFPEAIDIFESAVTIRQQEVSLSSSETVAESHAGTSKRKRVASIKARETL